jgi:hypothetical protein
MLNHTSYKFFTVDKKSSFPYISSSKINFIISLFAFARIPCSLRSAGAHAVQAPALHVRRVCCGELH